MGLLDDAIREHLELKRSRGADPTEVERQEREALGAAQQQAEFVESAGADSIAEPAGADSAEVEAEPEPESDEVAEAPEPFDVESLEPAPEPPPSAPEVDPWLEDERDEVPAEESLAHPREEDGEEPAEDVLEDTPDFLQETPEHDRLWFEQRPPRDFDWDK
jgi:hypothetical protein